MTLLQAILLGIVEGVTEFLPISSTAHLMLAQRMIGVESTEMVKSFDIAIQSGAILAVVFIYWSLLMKNRKLWKTVLVAFIPTAIIGFLLHSAVKTYLLGNIWIACWALIIGGIVLVAFEWFHHDKAAPIRDSGKIGVGRAVLIGIAQSLAIVPGVSRSAAAIVCGMSSGISRKAIVEFSFLLAIPTMAAATALDLVKSYSAFTADDATLMGVGFVFSFITAYVSIKWLLRYVQAHSLIAFGLYRIVLGAGVLWLII